MAGTATLTRVKCDCGRVIGIKPHLAGMKIACPNCKRPIEVPAAASPAAIQAKEDESQDRPYYRKLTAAALSVRVAGSIAAALGILGLILCAIISPGSSRDQGAIEQAMAQNFLIDAAAWCVGAICAGLLMRLIGYIGDAMADIAENSWEK